MLWNQNIRGVWGSVFSICDNFRIILKFFCLYFLILSSVGVSECVAIRVSVVS